MTADELVRAVDRLVDHDWTVGAVPVDGAQFVRCRYPCRHGARPGSAVGRPGGVDDRARRIAAVPRLDNDLVLPDQVRVTARDLLAAHPPEETVAAAIDAVADTRRTLF